MDALMKLSREVQIVLGGAVLYVIFSFLDWQQVSFGGISAGLNEWHGIGVVAALLALVLLAWEIGRVIEFKLELGSLTPGLVSAGLALLLLVFTVITFLSHNEARHWPSYIGLLLSIAIAAAAFKRAKGEGVEMPNMPKSVGAMGGAGGGTSTVSAPPDPPAATPPASSESDSEEA
jgi:hypothetical protein